MNKGDKVYTDRFCTVAIEEVFDTREEAEEQGYTEPAYYRNEYFGVLGKQTDLNHMVFAGYQKQSLGQVVGRMLGIRG